jgi:hypothetical protein
MAILCQLCGDIFPGTYFLDQLKLKATPELEDELLVVEETLELEDELFVAEELLELPSGETVHPIKPKETTIAKTKKKRKKVKNLAGSKIKIFFFILSP